MKKIALCLKLSIIPALFSLATGLLLEFSCRKEQPDPLIGQWKKAAPFTYEKGYSFYENGDMYRYFDKCLPLDSTDKDYTYTHRNDSVFISGPQGETAWSLEWISSDFIRVREPQTEYLTNIFFLERDYWGR